MSCTAIPILQLAVYVALVGLASARGKLPFLMDADRDVYDVIFGLMPDLLREGSSGALPYACFYLALYLCEAFTNAVFLEAFLTSMEDEAEASDAVRSLRPVTAPVVAANAAIASLAFSANYGKLIQASSVGPANISAILTLNVLLVSEISCLFIVR